MKLYSHQHIESLLDKFMDGESTLEEEALLGDYFRTHDVPAEWEDYRAMFGYFDLGMIQPVTHRRSYRRWWWTGTAAAAIGALVVGVTVVNHHPATRLPNSSESPVIASIDTASKVDRQDFTSLQTQPAVIAETHHLDESNNGGLTI